MEGLGCEIVTNLDLATRLPRMIVSMAHVHPRYIDTFIQEWL